MATEVRRRRGTTAEHNSFTGAGAETTVDTTKDTVVVHDGSTVGGFPLLREDGSNNGQASTFRSNMGLGIGTDVQAWDADLDTYAATPLTAAELGELQNINSVTITNTQWGYLGSLDQSLSTGDSPTFDGLSLTGELNTTGNEIRFTDATTSSFQGIQFEGTQRFDFKVGNSAVGQSDLQDHIYISDGTTTLFRMDSSGNNYWIGVITANNNINVTGNALQNVGSFSGSAIGTDLQAWDAELDTLSGLSSEQANDLVAITASEYTQLQNIDSVTISNTQWGYLGTLDQSLETSASPSWQQLSITNNLLTYNNTSSSAFQGIEFRGTQSFDFKVGNNAVGQTSLQDHIFISDGTTTLFRMGASGDSYWTGLLNANDGLAVTNTATFNDNVESDLFDNTTWAGTGYQGLDSGDWTFESVRVRGALEAYEFVAKQISSVGGKEILSIANGRIESVDTGASTITVQDVRGQNATSFKAGDLWIVQVVDINNDLESGGTGSIVKSVRGSVINDSSTDGTLAGNEIEVSVSSGALTDLEANDLIVAYGSSDSNRNAIMYRNVDRSDDNLIMRMQTGITSFSDLTDTANTAVAYGDLNGYLGIASEEFGFFAGDVSGNYVLATENQVDFQTAKFRLNTPNLDIDSSIPRIDVGSSHFLDGSTDSVSFANGILTANNTNVGIAGFTATATEIKGGDLRIRKDRNTIECFDSTATGDEVKAIYFGEQWFNFNTSTPEDDMGITVVDANNDIPFQATLANKNIAGFEFDNNSVWTDDGASGAGTFTGLQGGTGVRQFFAGADDNTGTNASFFVQDGELFYDALSKVIYSRSEIAGFTNGDTPNSIEDDFWNTDAQSDTGDTTETQDKVYVKFTKRFGEKNLVLDGTSRLNLINGAGANSEVRIILDVGNGTVSNTFSTSNTSDTDFSLSVDISSLTDDQSYLVTITIETFLDQTSAGTLQTASGGLFEDISVYTTT